MPTLITEAVNLSAAPKPSGRIKLRIIDEGQGSSGTYPAATLKAAAKDKVFAAGTHMYADHMSATESYDRPEGSIKNLAGVLETDAVYEDGALYAEAMVFPGWRGILEPEMFKHIGVSIRASAEVEEGNGGRTITKLVHAESVDFVTRAGRGGKVMEVLESARINTRAIERGVSEATANDTREWLSAAVKTAHGADDTYVWVRDFDDANAWFEVSGPEDNHLYQQAYTLSGNTATLTGNPVEVRIETRYVPITQATAESKNSPANPAGVQENGNTEENTVPKIEIEESELTQLRESASRVTALEAENATLKESGNKATAESIVAEAFGDVEAKATRKALIAAALAAESFDAAALKSDAVEAAAEYKAAHGEGNVHGVGETVDTVTESKKTFAAADIVGALNGEAK